MATLIIFLTLTVVNQIEGSLMVKRQYRDLVIGVMPDPEILEKLIAQLDTRGIQIRSIVRERLDGEGPRVIHFTLRLPPGLNILDVTRDLSRMSEVTRIEWE
jgi:glycine cleavage system regulatory protein